MVCNPQENAALCDEVAHLEEKFVRVKEEHRFLLKSLSHYQSVSEGEMLTAASTSSNPPVTFSSSPTWGSVLPGGHNLAPKPGLPKKPKKERKEGGRENREEDRAMLKKRKVADRGSRRPVFPIVLGDLTVYSLGDIITDSMLFHDPCAIYPVGFCNTRFFASMKGPDQQCLYTCQIKFAIVPEEESQNAIAASSALTCHSHLLKAIGADFFGFSHPTVQNLIQSFPGAHKCSNYLWIRFEVCHPGQVLHSLSKDNASVNFEPYQRHQGFDDSMRVEHNLVGEAEQFGTDFLYLALVLSHLDYCSVVWSGATKRTIAISSEQGSTAGPWMYT
uniref:Transforming growth factor beta regulator 1 n=1 Tax=Salmo trutta TaxID=8032 RepID=A0A674BY08_SALTR